MCAQFTVRTKKKDLARQMGIVPTDLDNDDVWNLRVVPYHLAPVVLAGERGRRFAAMQFSLIPKWSKTPKVKFATHNARLLSYDEKAHKTVPIYEKATWRAPFARRHCLVPMTDFIEPIYTGKMAGNMVAFHPRSAEPLCAAGIWEEWTSHETGEVIESFSVITNDPIPFVKETGHDRSPVFLRPDAFEAWLAAEAKSPPEHLALLQAAAAHYDWTAEIDRPLKVGWQKRAGGAAHGALALSKSLGKKGESGSDQVDR